MFCWELRTCVICVGLTPVCIIQGPLHSWSHDSILGSCTVHFSEDVGWFFLHLWGQVVVVICSQRRGLRHGVGCLFWVLAAAMRSGSSFQGRPVLVRVLIPQSRISGWLFLWSLLGWHRYLFLFGCWPFRSARSDPFWGLREVRHIERQYLTFWDLLCGRSLTEHPLIPSFNKNVGLNWKRSDSAMTIIILLPPHYLSPLRLFCCWFPGKRAVVFFLCTWNTQSC